MKRSVGSLVLIGMFLLVANLTFAQDDPPVNEDNPTTINQANSDTPEVAIVPTDTQVNSVNATSDSGSNQ